MSTSDPTNNYQRPAHLVRPRSGIAKGKVWLFSVVALMPWFACAFFVPTDTIIWLICGALVNAVVLYRFGLALVKPLAPTEMMPPVNTSSETQREHTEALSRALVDRANATRAQALAMEHLESGLLRLDESRQEAELAVLKAGESVKRLGALQKAQVNWLETHALSRLSRTGTMPDALRVINQQVESEVQRLVVQLQFHDVLDQKLTKVAGADIGAALLTLSNVQAQSSTQSSIQTNSSKNNSTSAERSKVGRNQNLSAATAVSVTPVKRGEIEFF